MIGKPFANILKQHKLPPPHPLECTLMQTQIKKTEESNNWGKKKEDETYHGNANVNIAAKLSRYTKKRSLYWET